MSIWIENNKNQHLTTSTQNVQGQLKFEVEENLRNQIRTIGKFDTFSNNSRLVYKNEFLWRLINVLETS